MPIQESRHSRKFVFEKSRATLLGVLIAANAVLVFSPPISTAEAGSTNNWTCTKMGGKAVHPSEPIAVRNAWKKWRQGAKAKCGAQCALLKYATNKTVSTYPRGSGYGAVVKANACYYLPGFGTTKSPGVGLRAPTRLP